MTEAVYAYQNAIKHGTPVPAKEPFELYATPQPLIDYAIQRFAPKTATRIIDLGCHDGRWGITAAQHVDRVDVLCGVDIRLLAKPEPFTHWYTLDYGLPMLRRLEIEDMAFDLVASNPPFSLAENFVRAAWNMLLPGGVMIFLLPLSFLASEKRRCGLWLDLPPLGVYQLNPRVNYEGHGNGQPRIDALYIWRKHIDGDVDGTAGLLPVMPVRWK